MLAPLPDAGVLSAVVTGADGDIYVFIGNIDRLPTRSFHVYDPRTNTWQNLGVILNARIAPAAATGPDGRVYVVGGSGDGNGKLLEVIPSSRRK